MTSTVRASSFPYVPERHAAVPVGWIHDFDSFATFVSEWGDVLAQATHRGWGVIGLRC
ncbi:hypothetical protein ACQPZG_32445 [Streptomyces sp. CA-294286]|uniref:hypothetical protein n=1 Tax=Streptomyces sp. CA-294286 TaxID=3240070 RepID=UPI003D8EA089